MRTPWRPGSENISSKEIVRTFHDGGGSIGVERIVAKLEFFRSTQARSATTFPRGVTWGKIANFASEKQKKSKEIKRKVLNSLLGVKSRLKGIMSPFASFLWHYGPGATPWTQQEMCAKFQDYQTIPNFNNNAVEINLRNNVNGRNCYQRCFRKCVYRGAASNPRECLSRDWLPPFLQGAECDYLSFF